MALATTVMTTPLLHLVMPASRLMPVSTERSPTQALGG
jgi:hypothetical protein